MTPIAPRWAGYTAALFGLEYAVAKAVMAARGELGVPGHTAPPEAAARFDGDIVTAQLGNAGLGLVIAALALALVHRWGRRIPAALLAAGAGAALLGGIAGVAVVATSLTGLREDHGQWGIDSLVLGVAPLAAWAVLTAHALRVAGLPRVRLGAGRRASCAAYGALKLHWALGGEFLLRQTPLPHDAMQDMLAREPGSVATHWASVALALVGIALALRPGLPRPLAVWLPALIGGLMIARAGWGIASDVDVLVGDADAGYPAGWDLGLWSPFFAAWGTAWIMLARSRYALARRIASSSAALAASPSGAPRPK